MQHGSAILRRRWLSDEQREQLDELLLDIIVEAYENYRRYPGRREPELTTTLLVEDVALNRRFADLDLLHPPKRRSLVDASLRRLQKRGLITFSLCAGERHAEVKCWEPV